MATFQIDTLKDIGAEEERGVIKKLMRSGLVTGLTDTTAPAWVATVLSLSAVPEYEDEITVNGDTLMVTDRSVSLGQVKGTAVVTITYENVLEEDTDPNEPTINYSGGASVQQIKVSKLPDDTPVQVTYGSDTQNGEIDVDETQITLRATLLDNTTTPGAVIKSWANKVNSDTWQGGAAGEWRVTSCSFELVSEDEQSWRFEFEFQFKEGGWQPYVTHWDATNNRPTTGVTVGDGIAQLTYYGTKAFGGTFPT